MFSLLLLSTILAAPSAAVQPTTHVGNLFAVEPPPITLAHHGLPEQMLEEQQQRQRPTRFDAMEIHPESDICFKIRAYVFSTGQVPKFLRETTCGPKRGEVKSIDGAKPKLVPFEDQEKTTAAPER
jgi:hypothetical protein